MILRKTVYQPYSKKSVSGFYYLKVSLPEEGWTNPTKNLHQKETVPFVKIPGLVCIKYQGTAKHFVGNYR